MGLARSLRSVALLAFAILHTGSPQLFPQRPQPRGPQVSFRTETALIEGEVRIKDRQGQPVAGLEKKDFTHSDNGKSQTLEK